MRARLLGAAAVLVVVLTGVANAKDMDDRDKRGHDVIAIDPSLFTFESTPGISSWKGNSLTLDWSVGAPQSGGGGFTQTSILPTSVLPPNIIGISFNISSSLPNPRISFAYLTYNPSSYGQGEVALVNSMSPTTWNLTTFSSLTSGLGGGRTTSDQVVSFLGSNYSPFSLNDSIHNPLSSYPLFSLDFRGDGWDGNSYLIGTVTFANINWITADVSSAVPEPSTWAMMLIGFIGLGVALRQSRRKVSFA
jgi:hypothetical protein